MAYILKTNYADKSNYGSYRNVSKIKYIVIHYTANDGDTDEANAKYFKKANRKASAHYFVDDDSVTISVPDTYVAWSVGGSRYSNYKTTGGAKYYKIATNTNTLNIEMCDTIKNGKYDIIVEANTLSPAKMQKRYYPTKFTSDGSLVDLGAVNLFQGKGESRKSKQFIGSIDFSEICIYAHGRNLDDIPVDITIEATDSLVIAHCLIPRSDIYGKDIKFKQVIHN